MLTLMIIFAAVSAYLFLGWLKMEKSLKKDKDTSPAHLLFNYYLWPAALVLKK